MNIDIPAENQTNLHIYSLSEQAVTIEFGKQISERLLQQINDLDQTIKQHPFPGFFTTVPAYATLTVFFDPLVVYKQIDLSGINCFDKVSNYIKQLSGQSENKLETQTNIVTIPVCYGADFGPDINYVADINSLSTAEVIALHTAAIYKVYMIGFVPGFAYMGGMNPILAAPRKSTPARAIPKGSVGIAGEQTGIYPLETPGGWQIIGQTPLKLFDAGRSQPSLLKAGDNVIFKLIDIVEFKALSR